MKPIRLKLKASALDDPEIATVLDDEIAAQIWLSLSYSHIRDQHFAGRVLSLAEYLKTKPAATAEDLMAAFRLVPVFGWFPWFPTRAIPWGGNPRDYEDLLAAINGTGDKWTYELVP